MNPLIDAFGRKITYLRLSITDRCNIRCIYCNPDNNYKHLLREEVLSYEETINSVSILSRGGITKVRVTGGEPTIRKGFVYLIRKIKEISGVNEVSLTTNGVRLLKYIDILPSLGLNSINLSLDTLKPEKYKIITGSDFFCDVFSGIRSLLSEGFKTLKINVVAIRGFNDDEIIDFTEMAKNNSVDVRFIEFMPVEGNFWSKEKFISADEIMKIIKGAYPELNPLEGKIGDSARMFSSKNFSGRVGVISPITSCFCENCNRLRLTSNGMLFFCLFGNNGLNIKELLRKNVDEENILKRIQNFIIEKPLKPKILNNTFFNRPMISIGG